MAFLTAMLPFENYDFDLCGPQPLMQSLHDGLLRLDVSEGHIFAETFGPAWLVRSEHQAAIIAPARAAATTAVPVIFAGSGKQARWEPGGGSLLELSGSSGLAADFSCRLGNCGTCRRKIIAGEVACIRTVTALAEGEARIC